jgi:predicted permease
MSALVNDVRLAARRLRQRPGFSVVCVLTLALGLGANTAIFTLVDAVMLQKLPVPRPHELYRLGDNDNCCVNSGLQTRYSLFSSPAYEHLRDRVPELSPLAAFQATVQPIGIRRGGQAVAESLPGQYVSANYFAMFGVQPAVGRLLEPADDRPGAEPVFVMSHRAWTDRFGRDSAVVGAPFDVAGKSMILAGVAAEEFFGDTIRPDPAAVWLPLGQEPYLRGAGALTARPDQDWLYAIGRLAPGSTPAAAEARASTELRQWLAAQTFLGEQDRAAVSRQSIVIRPAAGGVSILRYTYAEPLTILFVMSGLVLLIASANLANLLLARSDRGQVAIQAALGASTRRLIRQSVTEALLLSAAGCALGVLIASLATGAMLALAFPGARVLPMEVGPSASVVAFALALAAVTAVLFSAAPAWAMARADPMDALRGVGRAGEPRAFIPRRSLVIVQVALSVVLLSGAGLLTRSLGRLEGQPLGFESAGRIVVRIRPSVPADDRDRLSAFYDRIVARLRGIPGVVDVSYSLYSPMEGNNWSSGISIAGQSADRAGGARSSSWNRVGPRYFETMGTRVVRGRTIEARDTAGAPRVAVVNEAFVRRFFPDQDPLGARLGIGGPNHAADFEIVGVTEDVKYTAAEQPTRPMIFFPALQVADYEDATARNVQLRSTLMGAVELQVAGVAGAASLEPAIRRALADVDPNLPVVRVLSMADQVALNLRVNRLMARLTAAYGLLALALASLGLYGVTAHGVARRTREIGIRMALGADRSRVVGDVLRGAILQTGAGLVIGVPAALAASGTVATLLYGVEPHDPVIFGTAALALVVSATLAALLPARRAAAVDPSQALRGE